MSEGTAPGAEWSVLSELNPVFCERVSKVFTHVGNFCLAATTVGDVHEIVNEVMSDALKAEDRHALAEAVYRWCLRHQGIVGRTVRELGDRVRRGPYIMRAPGPSAAEVYEGLLAADPALGLAALEKKLKLRKAGAGARVEAEDACRRRWGLRLASVIKEAGLPASERIGALPDSDSAWLRAFGSRRGKTLKNRARTWEPVRSWMLQATGKPWPGTTSLLLQYFDERHQCKPMGKTVPQSILSSLCLLELVGQVPPSERLSSDPLLVETVKAWTMQLETVAEPVKQAELVTVAMVLSAEILLVKVGTPAGLRFGCFIFLLMCWGTLRCDDIQGIDPSSITLSQLGMKFTLTRTKTSGPGKRIGQLQGYLLRGLSLSDLLVIRIRRLGHRVRHRLLLTPRIHPNGRILALKAPAKVKRTPDKHIVSRRHPAGHTMAFRKVLQAKQQLLLDVARRVLPSQQGFADLGLNLLNDLTRRQHIRSRSLPCSGPPSKEIPLLLLDPDRCRQ